MNNTTGVSLSAYAKLKFLKKAFVVKHTLDIFFLASSVMHRMWIVVRVTANLVGIRQFCIWSVKVCLFS